MAEIPITKEGYQAVVDELNKLKKVERPDIIKKIAEARSHGDLKENAEYHAARERQSFIEGRIAYLEGIVAESKVIDPSSLSGSKVLFGATVTILDLESDEETTYKIVSEVESDPKNGKISVTSPIGRALIGKNEGDELKVQTPSGVKEFEVVEVQFI